MRLYWVKRIWRSGLGFGLRAGVAGGVPRGDSALAHSTEERRQVEVAAGARSRPRSDLVLRLWGLGYACVCYLLQDVILYVC